MEANDLALQEFLTKNKTQFVIPVYQRNYDWKQSQCKQLLKDILDVGRVGSTDTHFIGSIVFIHDGVYTTSEVKPLVIIDGQQRLTTITLIFLALYHFAKQNNMEAKATEINDTILINKFVEQDDSKLKLKQTVNNAKAFQYLVKGKDPNSYPEFSRIVNNYQFFNKNIDKDNFQIIWDGINRLLFVEVSLERGKDDPQRIFESLNSTGLELSQADLIRNYILMGLEPKKQIKMFEKYWEPIEGNAKIESSEENKVSDFIRDYLTFENKKIPNKSKVYEEFKERYKERDESFYSITLSALKDYSKLYNKLLNPSKEPVKRISEELASIRQLEINVSYPFLLPVYNDYVNSIIGESDFVEILKLIQSFTWRRFVLGLPTNSLNKIFMTLYGDVKKGDYLKSIQRSLLKKSGSQRFPNNSEIHSALLEKDIYSKRKKNVLYFLRKLEHHNNREKVDVSAPEITIEHIFPQNPDPEWKNALPKKEFKEFEDIYLHTIANLTLSGNNGALGNKVFKKKKFMNVDDKEQGYIFSNFWLNRYLKEIEEWNLDNYIERFDRIYKRFIKIWEYPEVDLIFNDEEEEYSIFDAPDPTYKKLEYFIFKDEKIIEQEVSKMYYHVISELFKINPSILLNTSLKEQIGLTSKEELLRAPYEIAENYFIESNIDNMNKFKKLRQLLTEYDSEDDLTIKYSE